MMVLWVLREGRFDEPKGTPCLRNEIIFALRWTPGAARGCTAHAWCSGCATGFSQASELHAHSRQARPPRTNEIRPELASCS